METDKVTKYKFIHEIFWYFGNILYLCNPKTKGDILAVVVKWYTRYFEGVVGASPCEFDSHLPHKIARRISPPGFFVCLNLSLRGHKIRICTRYHRIEAIRGQIPDQVQNMCLAGRFDRLSDQEIPGFCTRRWFWLCQEFSLSL